MLNLRLLLAFLLINSFQLSAQCPPSGDPNQYGNGHWRGYLYGTKTFTDYRGFTIENEQFNWNIGAFLVWPVSDFEGTNICGNFRTNFSVRYRMTKNFASGFYSFTVGGDDGYRLSTDGGATWLISNWSDHSYQTTTETVYLSGSTNLVLEYYQNNATARLRFDYTLCAAVTAPNAITGATCNTNSGMTLTASGGALTNGSIYQWGTGTVPGQNIISSGQWNSTHYVNPTVATTYWVRIYNSNCQKATPAAFTTVSMASSGPNWISGPASTCPGSPVTLQANGGNPGTNATYEWGSGAVGSNIISGQTGATISVSPTVSTQYWVRLRDAAPCNSTTPAKTFTVNVIPSATAPTHITSSSVLPLCPGFGGTTLSAMGGSNSSASSYQWGTGSVVGANIINGQSNNTLYVNPSVTTTYWVRRLQGSTCNTPTAGVVLTVNVATYSVTPTSISGSATVCAGNNLTLTAVGGTVAPGGSYQWGTGYTVGQNPIAGANSVSITVNPTTSTVYWVRIIDAAPCYRDWIGGVTKLINITNSSTAPTSISGGSITTCASSSITLTANGGTANPGSTFQWGTGSVPGSNIISGTGASITVSPSATTTYWVRRYDPVCGLYTAHVSTVVTIGPPSGNPAQFGNNIWNVYGYAGGDLTLATATYAGYYTQNTLGFNSQSGTNSWINTGSPSNSAGWIGCPVPQDNFTTVHKRKGFPCGTYVLTMQLWDDSSILYIDGVPQWSCNDWSGANSCNGLVGTFNLDANSEIEVRTRENSGLAGTILNIANVTVAPTAPTTLTSTNNTICAGSTVILTANGGSNGSTGSFEWGTGTVGQNIIAGETAATLTVNPNATTTYWVRRRNDLCGGTTAGRTRTITVNPATVAGVLSTESTLICRNSSPGAITLTGNVGNVVRWQSCNNASFAGGITNIANTSNILTSADMGTITNTKYYRAVVRSANCTTEYTAPIQIGVPATVTYSAGSWTETPSPATDVIITDNLILPSNLEVCSCKVTANATLTIPENVSLIVKKNIEVSPSGTLIIENNGSLVQRDNNNTNNGSITVKRRTMPMKQYDYTYWSAPVQNMSLYQLSPATLFDKYHSFNPIINNWQTIANGAQQMEPASGYIVRAPQNWSLTNASGGIYQAVFNGPPNNGTVPVNLAKGATTMNLIGNPYPSAIDIDLFLTDPINENLLEGTIYLWTHNTAISPSNPGSSYSNYTANDYAKYNLTGGVKTASAAISGSVVPTGKIASGQAFFIEMNAGLPNGTYEARFTNEMRIANNNSQFFRSAEVQQTVETEKHRLWLGISNAHGNYDEMLLGYVSGATNDLDSKYDGKTFAAGNPVGLYSLLGQTQLSIQGRALPFDSSEIIPLGFTAGTAGNFTIVIEDADGLFDAQQVYLVDKTTNTTNLLTSGSYTFSSAAGTFNNRFELQFSNTLGTGEFMTADFAIASADKRIQLRSGSNRIISVMIYDLSGRKIFSADKINDIHYSTPPLNIGTQVLMVSTSFEDGTKITRKVITE